MSPGERERDAAAYQVPVVGGAGALLGDSHAEAGQAAFPVLCAQVEVVGLAAAARGSLCVGLEKKAEMEGAVLPAIVAQCSAWAEGDQGGSTEHMGGAGLKAPPAGEKRGLKGQKQQSRQQLMGNNGATSGSPPRHFPPSCPPPSADQEWEAASPYTGTDHWHHTGC